MLRKIEIGGGSDPAPGFEQISVVWGRDRLPFDNESVDVIYSSHVIEHIPWYSVMFALSEACRILKHDGEIIIHTPDLDYLISCYLNRKAGDNWDGRGLNPEMDFFLWFNSRLFNLPDKGEGPESLFWHRSTWSEGELIRRLNSVGFRTVKRSKDRPLNDIQNGPINMCIKAIK
jgi:SAM-dependent methyltransferase